MFRVNCALIEELLKDAKWTEQLEKAKSFGEVEKVLRRFAKAKNFKIQEVKTLL